MPKVKPTYHIIGAGIAGLSSAKFIRTQDPDARIFIYEAAGRPGGRCLSYEHQRLGFALDNATHVVLRGNNQAADLLGGGAFKHKVKFFDPQKWEFCRNWLKRRKEICEAVFNTAYELVPFRMKAQTAAMLFPFFPGSFKLYFSQGDLKGKLVDPLLSFPDEIIYNCRLESFEEKDGRIEALHFANRMVKIASEDKIICALDAYNYGKIFGYEPFEYNEIINIFYRTSMKISLPGGEDCLGLFNSPIHWLFSSPGILAVTISNSANRYDNSDETARQIWAEVCRIRGREPAFVPAYQIIRHKRATIRQDAKNNRKRPSSTQSKWQNMRLAGDWVMKNYPCCLETAILSAKRAASK